MKAEKVGRKSIVSWKKSGSTLNLGIQRIKEELEALKLP